MIPEIRDVRRIHLYIRSISSDRSRSDCIFGIVFLRVGVPFRENSLRILGEEKSRSETVLGDGEVRIFILYDPQETQKIQISQF